MPVVLVQPDRELLSTLIGIVVGSGIGPLVQGGLDQPHVIRHPTDPRNLINDPAGELLQELVGQMRPAGGHEVDGLHGAQGDDVFVAAGVADDTDGFDRQEDGEGQAGFVVEAGGVQFLDEDVVRQTQGVGVFLLYFAEDAHAQAGAGEGVAVHHVVGQTECNAGVALLVGVGFAGQAGAEVILGVDAEEPPPLVLDLHIHCRKPAWLRRPWRGLSQDQRHSVWQQKA